eukprot:TRINITY_DN40412_c0_g1_i1.p2 TRINITY_DN40412_c0_g1~~TRINITY_DN40412_c0_g1_i1.p2  ORF type:complete len:101 (-),score=14.18 TRINITY_DN40412_c0_g1_i1:29-331(-)
MKEAAGRTRRLQAKYLAYLAVKSYAICWATLLKVEEVLEPRAVTAPMIATAIRAAIRPYSMAVAPDSFLKNVRIGNSHYADYRSPGYSWVCPRNLQIGHE